MVSSRSTMDHTLMAGSLCRDREPRHPASDPRLSSHCHMPTTRPLLTRSFRSFLKESLEQTPFLRSHHKLLSSISASIHNHGLSNAHALLRTALPLRPAVTLLHRIAPRMAEEMPRLHNQTPDLPRHGMGDRRDRSRTRMARFLQSQYATSQPARASSGR